MYHFIKIYLNVLYHSNNFKLFCNELFEDTFVKGLQVLNNKKERYWLFIKMYKK